MDAAHDEKKSSKIEGHIVSPQLVRHSTRLETLGRTVKQYIHIPHTLSSLSPLSVSNAPSQAQGSSTSPKGKNPRPVSFGHYSLSGSGLQAPRFGQLLDEDVLLPVENAKDDIIHAAWYNAHGRTLLLVTYSDGLQLWDATHLDAVRELAHYPAIGPLSSATILSRPNARNNDHTLLLMLLGAAPNTQLHVYSLASHSIIHRHAVPHATSIQASNSFIVVSASHPSPSLHVFSSTIPEFPLLHVLPMSQTSTLIFALSGRLLAYSSSTPPSSAADAEKYAYATTNARTTSTSVAIMDTAVKGAVDIGSGVWSGVKALGGMAFDAASRSTSSDNGGPKFGFSKSMPNSSSPLGMLGVRKRLSEVFSGGGIPRIDESGQTGVGQTGVVDKGSAFVTVVDLMPVHGPTSSPRKVAEFRWVNPPRTNSHFSQGISSLAWNPNATQLAVSGTDGLVTRIFSIRPRAAAYEASIGSEKEIEAASAGETVWHVYDLVRGATKADVGELVWEKDGRWVGFGSSNGTIHAFATNSYGGQPDPYLHLEGRVHNAVELQPLGVVLHPNVRVRAMSANESPQPQPTSAITPTTANVGPLPFEKQLPPSFTFITNIHSLSSAILPNPLRPSTSTSHYRRASASTTPIGSLTSSPRLHAQGLVPSPTRSSHNGQAKQAFQDVLLFNKKEATLALARITVRVAATERQDTTPGSTNLSVSASSGSGGGTLTRIVNAAGGIGAGLSGAGTEDSGLVYEESVVATWNLRRANDWGEVKGVFTPVEDNRRKATVRSKTEYLAHAELSSFSKMPSIVPNSVYLSHQFNFGALYGGDYYALLTRGDLAVPAQEVKVRKEVVVRPGSRSSPGDEVGDSEGFMGSPSSALIDLTGGAAAPTGFSRSYGAQLGGFGSMGGAGVPITSTSSTSSHGHGGVRNSFDEGLASAISSNLSPTASPGRRVLPALPNGMPTSQMRHRGHDPRTLVDVGSKGVKELGRLGRGIASKVGERTGSIGVAGLRSPRTRPLASPPCMLEFDEADEIFAVDGLDLGAPVTAADEPRRSFVDVATIRAAPERPLTSSRSSVVPGSFGDASPLMGGVIGLDTGMEVSHRVGDSGSSETISLLAPLPRILSPTIIPSTEEDEWVGKAEVYHEAVEEPACYDDVDVDITGVVDDEVVEAGEREEISKAIEEMSWRKRTRGKKGKKR